MVKAVYVLKVENLAGNILTLTQNESKFQILSVTGLNPPPATVNRSAYAGMDGTKFNSAKLNERNVVITVKVNGNVEKNRLFLYQFFGTKHWCKIYYYNSSRAVYIEGYVETVECDLFTNKQTLQISVICNNPYFKSLKEIVDDISKTTALFEFPFAFGAKGVEAETITDDAIEFSNLDNSRIINIINQGELVTGLVIEITINGSGSNPTIQNIETGERFGIHLDFNTGDQIVIDTNQGSKNITLIRDGVEQNIFNRIVKDSDWLQLRMGDNFFAYSAEVGAEFMNIIFKHYYLYEGV